ncbi:MAG TPA: methyltransferase, FxLD system [Anaerolineae bacterium]|nr:methyltransferase, FxLD system [Anaerolineae bacterium]
MEASELHRALVDQLKHEGHITTTRVEAAFRAIPRHLFLPHVAVAEVYRDIAIVTKRLNDQPISSSSQPAMMAIMLEQLELQPGQHVLEIGTGTGYNAALLAQLVGDAGLVVTMDLDQDLVDDARAHLATAGIDRVQVIRGEGGTGHPAGAPYDRIILTVGTDEILPAWHTQLKPGGRLVLPLSIRLTQKSIGFESTRGYLTSTSIKDCGFMMLRGDFAGPGCSSPLGPTAGLHFTSANPDEHDLDKIYQWLLGPSQDWSTGVRVTDAEIWGGLSLWLDLHESGFCNLWAEGDMATRGIIPVLFAAGDDRMTSGLVGHDSLCLLRRPPDTAPQANDATPFELFVRNYATRDTLARHLIERIRAWDTAGRPGSVGLRIRAYPPEVDYQTVANEILIRKKWSQLVLDWPQQPVNG